MFEYLLIFPLILILSLDYFNRNNDSVRILALGILMIFMGIRYGVGVDYFNYKDIFFSGEDSVWIEPGYFFLMKLVHLLNGDFFWVTTIVAFLTLFFLFNGLRKYTPLYVFSLFLFLTFPTGYGFTVNGMRQGITAAIFLYSLKFIIEDKFWKYLFLLLLGSLFHVSLLVLIPLYFIRNLDFKRKLYLLVIIGTIVLNQLNVFYSILIKILSYTPWESYLGYERLLTETSTSSGLGFLFTNIIGLIIIAMIPTKIISQKKYLVIFNFYVLFLILRNVFFSVAILYRMVVYFDWVSFLAIPIFVFYTFNFRSKRVVAIFLLLLYTILFYKALINPEYMLQYDVIDI